MDHLKDILKGFHEHFGWFIWTLVAIGVLWFFGGGVNNPSAHRAYIKPLAPLDSGQVYGQYYAGSTSSPNETLDLPQSAADAVRAAESAIAGILADAAQVSAIHTGSSLVNGLSIKDAGGATASDPNKEYVVIGASSIANSPIQLSGLRLVGTNIPKGIVIPKAAELFELGSVVATNDVYLPPSGRAIVTSGASPFGGSFRANACSGYLNEIAVFAPALKTACPDGSGCHADSRKGFSYNACVARHKNDRGFYANEWRIFLGQTKELWNNSKDVVGIVNLKGNLVDAVSY